MGVEAIVAVVASVVAAGASAYGAYSSGQAASEAADYNAKVADIQGKSAQDAADLEAEDRRKRGRALLGTQLATAGASGVALEGSPLLMMVDSGVNEELEARRIQYKGYLAALGAGSQAALSRYQGSQTARAGQIGAGTSLLRGGYSTYQAYKTASKSTP
jgi:hypothetical protein